MLRKYYFTAMILLLLPAKHVHASDQTPAPPNPFYAATQVTLLAATFAYGCGQVVSLISRALNYGPVDYLGEYEIEVLEQEVKAAFKKDKSAQKTKN